MGVIAVKLCAIFGPYFPFCNHPSYSSDGSPTFKAFCLMALYADRDSGCRLPTRATTVHPTFSSLWTYFIV